MTHLTTSLAGAAALALTAGVAVAQDYTMRLSHQFPPTHHTAVRLEQFEKDVEANTDGKVDVQIFGAAQLYSPGQHHAAVASGEIESAIILNIQWGGTIPEMAVTVIPFLTSSPAAQEAFMGSEAAAILDEAMLAKGVKNIAWVVDANDLIFTSSKGLLTTPEAFRGIKIRGLTRLFDEGLVALGATPVNMPGSETYQALQTGVIDAGVTSPAAAYTRKFYEVQDYGTAAPMFLVFDNLVVNPAWWDGLPEDVQSGIDAAAETLVESSLIKQEGVDPATIQQLNDVGMEAVVLDQGQIDALKAVMQPPVMDAFLAETGETGQKLLDILTAN